MMPNTITLPAFRDPLSASPTEQPLPVAMKPLHTAEVQSPPLH